MDMKMRLEAEYGREINEFLAGVRFLKTAMAVENPEIGDAFVDVLVERVGKMRSRPAEAQCERQGMDEKSVEKNPAIENNFSYHAPKEGQGEKYAQIRMEGKRLAYTIDALVPASREKSLAMTNLEQAVMWANAGIARN